MAVLLENAREQQCLTASVATPPFCEDLVELYAEALKPNYRLDNFYQYHVLDCHPLDKLKAKR